jgi:hypothetical protein
MAPKTGTKMATPMGAPMEATTGAPPRMLAAPVLAEEEALALEVPEAGRRCGVPPRR